MLAIRKKLQPLLGAILMLILALACVVSPATAQAPDTTADVVYGQDGSFTSNTAGISANNLVSPRDVVLDGDGNLYVSDSGNNRVLFYPAGSTTATRVYGQGGSFTSNTGGISANSLFIPRGVALDGAGNLYVADQSNNRVLFYPAGSTTATRVYGQGGSFTTGTENTGGLSANSLYNPHGVELDGDGNLYVADEGNSRVLFYAAGSTTATRVYGQGGSFTTGTSNKGGLSANSLSFPQGVALDGDGNLYVTDQANHRALFYAAGSTTATRVYGQGGSFITGTRNKGGLSANSLSNPFGGVALDSDGNLYVVDTYNNRVLFYVAGSTTATRVYGQGGSFTTGTENTGGISADSLSFPTGVALDSDGNLYVADINNSRVLLFNAKLSQTITFGALSGKTFGDGTFNVSATASPSNLAVSFGAAGNCTVAGTLVTITGAGSCTITASQAGDPAYFAATDVPQSFAIAKATPVTTWSNPADIPQGTALSSTQLNATVMFNGSNISGTFVYTPGSGTVLSAGSNQQLKLDFTPADNTNYNTPAQKVVSINVVDALSPTVQSIVRGNASPTNAGSVSWTVTLSENVTGVDATDFALAQSGVSGATFTISGGNNIYTVTANTGTGSGTLGLNLVDDDTIKDSANNVLGGTGAANGNFTGEVYTIDKTGPDTNITSGPTGTITVSTATFQYSSSEANSTFECSLDSAVFSTCPAAGVTYNGLAPGNHTFQVRAIDVLGNIDPSPASQAFSFGPALAVVPNSAVRGGSVTATWSGIISPSPTDWIGLYQVGAPNSPFWDWEYVSCSKSATVAKQAGSCSFSIPSPPNGTYELRLFSNNVFTRLATSNPFTIGVAPTLPVVTITATTNAVEPSTNGSFTVTRSIVSADPLTVNYTVGGSAAANGDYTTLSGAVTIPSNAQTAPITVSPIDDNVFEGNESVIVTLTGNPAYTLGSPSNATLQIIDNETAPSGPTITVIQGSVVRGGSVTVTWSGIVSPSATDWFGLYQVGAPNSPFWEWEYVSCTKSATTAKVSGSCTFPIPVNPPAGNYNLRLFSNNNFTLLTTSNPFVLQ